MLTILNIFLKSGMSLGEMLSFLGIFKVEILMNTTKFIFELVRVEISSSK